MTKRDILKLAHEIAGYAIKVHKALGPGLLESVYEKCLKYELLKNGYKVDQHYIIPVVYDGIRIQTQLRLDLLADDSDVVELKAQKKCILYMKHR